MGTCRDGSLGCPATDEWRGDRARELGGAVAVLGEDCQGGKRGVREGGDKAEDVREGGREGGGEIVLAVDGEEGGCHNG